MATGTVKLVRHDLSGFGGTKDKDRSFSGNEGKEIVEQIEIPFPADRECFLRTNLLPVDSILKVKVDGKLIPWSLLPLSTDMEIVIHVLRPHQTGEPVLVLPQRRNPQDNDDDHPPFLFNSKTAAEKIRGRR